MNLPATPTPWRPRVVHSGPVDLAVFELGDPEAPTVLLVHGWPDTHHLWNGVAPLLAERFHVVAYDTRGMGESGDPGAMERFALAELASDLFAVADAVSPDAPVHVVAHDWGSAEAWEAVCEPRAAERIASFVTMSGPSADHVGHWVRRNLRHRSVAGVRDVVVQLASSSYMALFVSPLGPRFVGRFDRDSWGRFLQRTEGIEPSPAHHAPTLPQDLVSGLRYYRANVGRGLGRVPRERRTSVPVLLLVAGKDRAIRPAVVEEARRWATDVERRDHGYGHWVPLADPQLVADEVTRFVDLRATPPAP